MITDNNNILKDSATATQNPASFVVAPPTSRPAPDLLRSTLHRVQHLRVRDFAKVILAI